MSDLMNLLKQAIAQRQSFTELKRDQEVQVANTAQEQEEGLRNKPLGTSMVFPNSRGNFNTRGMKYNINIDKYNDQGHLVQSYRNVPPGIDNLPMGDKTGTVIETPSEYKKGGPVKYQGGGSTNTGWGNKENTKRKVKTFNYENWSKKELDAFIKEHNLTYDNRWKTVHPKGQAVKFSESDYLKWLENPELVWKHFNLPPNLFGDVKNNSKFSDFQNFITGVERHKTNDFHEWLTSASFINNRDFEFKDSDGTHKKPGEQVNLAGDTKFLKYKISNAAPYLYYAAANKIPLKDLHTFIEGPRNHGNIGEFTKGIYKNQPFVDYVGQDWGSVQYKKFDHDKGQQVNQVGLKGEMGYPINWFVPKVLVQLDVTGPGYKRKREREERKKTGKIRRKKDIIKKEDTIEEVPVIKEYDFSQNVFPDTFHKGTEEKDRNAVIVLDGYNYYSPQEYVAHMQKVGRPVNVHAINNRATKEELGLIKKDGQWWAGNEGYNPNYGKKGYMPSPLKWEGDSDKNPSKKKIGGPINYQTEGEIPDKDLPQLIVSDDTERAYYDPHPLANTIHMNRDELNRGTVLPHEMFHWQQREAGGLFENPLLTPHPAGPVTEETLYSHYDRRQHDLDRQTQDEFTFFPESKMVPNFTRNVVAEQQMYNNPYTAEGEASMFESHYRHDPAYINLQSRVLRNAKYKKTGGPVKYQKKGSITMTDKEEKKFWKEQNKKGIYQTEYDEEGRKRVDKDIRRITNEQKTTEINTEGLNRPVDVYPNPVSSEFMQNEPFESPFFMSKINYIQDQINYFLGLKDPTSLISRRLSGEFSSAVDESNTIQKFQQYDPTLPRQFGINNYSNKTTEAEWDEDGNYMGIKTVDDFSGGDFSDLRVTPENVLKTTIPRLANITFLDMGDDDKKRITIMKKLNALSEDWIEEHGTLDGFNIYDHITVKQAKDLSNFSGAHVDSFFKPFMDKINDDTSSDYKRETLMESGEDPNDPRFENLMATITMPKEETDWLWKDIGMGKLGSWFTTLMHEIGHVSARDDFLSERDARILKDLNYANFWKDEMPETMQDTMHQSGFHLNEITTHEAYADLTGVRLDMLEKGIYDYKTEQMTIEHWQEYVKSYDPDMKTTNENYPISLQRMLWRYRLPDDRIGRETKYSTDPNLIYDPKGTGNDQDSNIRFINNSIAGISTEIGDDIGSPAARSKTGGLVQLGSGGLVQYQTEGEVTGTRIPYHAKTREEEIEFAQQWSPYGGTGGSIQDWQDREQNEYYTKYEGVTEADIKKKYKKLNYRSDSQGDETRKEWKQRIKLEEEAELKEFAVWPQKVQDLKDEEWAKYNEYRHETPEGNIERDKAKAYFTNYFESPKFKERVIAQYGEENYEAIKAEKLEMLNTLDFYETDPEAFLYSVGEGDYIGQHKDYIMTTGSYKADTHTAQYNVAQSEKMGMPLDAIIVNEITHGTGATDYYKAKEDNPFAGLPNENWKGYVYDPETDTYIPDPNAYGVKSVMSDYERNIASKRKESAVKNNHDERPTEVKSDIESTRYELSTEDMYDFNDPDFQFTEEHLEYMRNNPEKFQKFNKVLSRDYEDEVILEMMNVFVENDEIMDDTTDPNRTMRGQTGGVVNYQSEGQLQKYSENATDEEKRNYWLNLNSDKNFVQRILNPDLNHGKEIPHPESGLRMSHAMESGEINGMPVVYPRVVEVPGENRFHYFETSKEAQAYAAQTGEYIVTDTHEEAIWLAKDNYKTPEFVRAYGDSDHKKQMGGFWHIEQPKKKQYQTGGSEETKEKKEHILFRTGRSAEDDLLDKQFLKKIAMKIVDERRGEISQEEALKKVEFLMNFVGRQESYYNPELNSSGELPYIPMGVTNTKTQINPAEGAYHFKPDGLKTAMQRVKNFLGSSDDPDSFYHQAKNYGWIDENAKPGSRFNPYWYTELQDHMDPNQLTKTQQDILILLDWAEGDAKLTDYIQGNISEVDFYMHGHHRGERGKNYDKNLEKEIRSKATGVFEAYESEVEKGNYDKYSLFDGVEDVTLRNLFLKEGYKNQNVSGFLKNYKRIKEINSYQTQGFLSHPVDNTYVKQPTFNIPEYDKKFNQNIDKDKNNIISNFEFLLSSNKPQDEHTMSLNSFKRDITQALIQKGYTNPVVNLDPNNLSGAWVDDAWMTDGDIFGNSQSSSSTTSNVVSTSGYGSIIDDDPLLGDINNDPDEGDSNLDVSVDLDSQNELLNQIESSDWINSPSFMRRSKKNQYALFRGADRPIFQTRSGFTLRKYRGKST